jgi:protein-tyrosine kinase
VSKIQNAIRKIQKSKSAEVETESMLAMGEIVSKRVDALGTDVGDETPQRAVLGDATVQRSISVDRDALRSAGFFASENEERVLVDQYRQIKRPLVAHAFGKRATKIRDGHLILISSALPGDGKTFTCINLALSIAREQDRSVLLVDADVAKAHITRLFGAEGQPGLLDLLEEDSLLNLDDTILKTDITGMSVMTAGAMRSHSTELLASERMESLIRALSAQDPNRIVLFDSSPILATSESLVLSSLVGQVVLVVAAEQTPQQAVLEAIAAIDENKPVNLVLNQARYDSADGYNSYGYGYGRESGGEN